MKKEFDYHFSTIGEYFNLEWTAKKLDFKKVHFNKIEEDIRLENLTDKPLEITISEHDIIKHNRIVKLKPKANKLVKMKIDCSKIDGKHKSFLHLKSPNQTAKVPILIEHIK